jgi:hypothetical protein
MCVCLDAMTPGVPCLVSSELWVASCIPRILLPFRQQCGMLVEHVDGIGGSAAHGSGSSTDSSSLGCIDSCCNYIPIFCVVKLSQSVRI